jgi:hypothetical protein
MVYSATIKKGVKFADAQAEKRASGYHQNNKKPRNCFVAHLTAQGLQKPINNYKTAKQAPLNQRRKVKIRKFPT